MHYINCKVLTKLLLLDIHAKAMLAQNSPVALKEKILAQKNAGCALPAAGAWGGPVPQAGHNRG